MARESSASTPLILWICAAVCAHYMFAEGGGEVAKTYEDHSFIEQMGLAARDRVTRAEQTFDIGDVAPTPPDQPPPEVQPPPPPKPPEKEKKKDEPKAPEEKKPEPPKPIAIKKVETTPTPPPPPPQQDRRIAVRQHVQADQKDNPTAQFIADQANKVEKETVATQTSHDEDAPVPTPGGNHAGPTPNPGDANQTKIADSSEHAGEKDHAPGEKGTEFEVQHDNSRVQTSAQQPSASNDPRGDQHAEAANLQGQSAPPEGQSQPAGPASVDANGNWSFNPIAPGGAPGQSQDNPRQKSALNQNSTTWLGFGQQAAPGQVNLNLSNTGLMASVGQDQLRKEREADGERRLSQHRGSWASSGFDHWKNAIENYVTSVKPGNQTALNTAAVPFATYLNGMHNRIHPIFADSFLGSLDGLPKTHPLNDTKLVTSLEIVLTKEGRLQKMGIVKTSGLTAFDVAALDSVNRAQPFGPAPSAIVSPDGNVYLHWEFHRDEVYACSTMNARPFLLKGNATGAPAGPEPQLPPAGPRPPNPEERLPSSPGRESRSGMYILPAVAKSGATST